jgi:hypothetical protein
MCACAYCNRKSPQRSEGIHHGPQHTRHHKTGQNQTSAPPESQERLERDRRQAQYAAEALH